MAVRIKPPRSSYLDAGLTDVATDLASVVRQLNSLVRWVPEVVSVPSGATVRVGQLSLLDSSGAAYLPSDALPGESVIVAAKVGSATLYSPSSSLVEGSASQTVTGKATEYFFDGKDWV